MGKSKSDIIRIDRERRTGRSKENKKEMPRNVELHLIRMFFGISPTQLTNGKERKLPTDLTLEEKIGYKIRRQTVRYMLATTIPQKYGMDTSKFTGLEGYWIERDSLILSDRSLIIETLKRNHNLSLQEITGLMENYIPDEELDKIPSSFFHRKLFDY